MKLDRMKDATYVGHRSARLFGKRALVFEAGEKFPGGIVREGFIRVQLHDMATGLGHGWHEFPASDWKINPPVDWGDE